MPIDKLTQIISLTITGHLYDTDIEIIKQQAIVMKLGKNLSKRWIVMNQLWTNILYL